MDTVTRDRELVTQVIQRYAQFKPSHGNIRLDVMFDQQHDRYALMPLGWDRGRRVRGNLIYVTLHDGKVWVEYVGMEQGHYQRLNCGGDCERRNCVGVSARFAVCYDRSLSGLVRSCDRPLLPNGEL